MRRRPRPGRKKSRPAPFVAEAQAGYTPTAIGVPVRRSRVGACRIGMPARRGADAVTPTCDEKGLARALLDSPAHPPTFEE